jgi:ABC-type transporter Mla subunit MlaD
MATASPHEAASAQGAELGQEARSLASSVVDAAQNTVRNVVDQQKTAVADQVAEVAQVLDTVAESVERVLPQAAPLVREAVSTVQDASATLRDTSLDELLAMATDFGRRQPAAFLAACTLGGFILARFLKSSADRQREARARLSTHAGHAQRPAQGAGAERGA